MQDRAEIRGRMGCGREKVEEEDGCKDGSEKE